MQRTITSSSSSSSISMFTTRRKLHQRDEDSSGGPVGSDLQPCSAGNDYVVASPSTCGAAFPLLCSQVSSKPSGSKAFASRKSATSMRNAPPSAWKRQSPLPSIFWSCVNLKKKTSVSRACIGSVVFTSFEAH